MTLKVISDRKFKIIPISKKHRHFTRKAYEYSAMAWQVDQESILINYNNHLRAPSFAS
jgi:hypothetical protein